ncbi:hypothetical protein ACQ4PT_047293 [Festuca glaucescens]
MSHALRRDATVHSVLTTGVRQSLVPRLTDTGERQLPSLLALVNEVVLAEAADTRVLTRCRKRLGGLDASAMYKLRSWGGVDAPSHDFVWKNSAPSKVQFFAWPLTKARVQSRAALLRKNILSAAEAGCPICQAPLETANHIFFGCSFARRFWDAVGFSSPSPPPPDADVRLLHEYGAPAEVPADSDVTFTLLCLWNLWKHRNAVAFREQQACLPLLLRACREEAWLWRVRLPGNQELTEAAWLRCLTQGTP